ncbi:hypothetical protein [Microbacterium lacticum]|uniref:hypothetical protein n=1 Tax=Microbacterium lacticum TaxID=33885 RepID=UPI0018B0201B|nr:hypothetical protein [Microbacterium lacticum]MBF9337478.1 hypothetical protein [Microbacterium lacticum]
MSEETQDEPALDQHETTEQERLDGVIAQLRADVAGEDAAVVETAVRRRLDDTGIAAEEGLIARLVAELAG